MDERRKKQTSTFRVVQIPGSEMSPLCLNGWIRCWQQVWMHRSNITLFISPKTRAGWSFLYVLIQMWLTRPDQTRAHPTNHIHAGSADYSCRYQDIIGWKEKGIKTFIYNNICAFQFCLSPISHRTFSYLCRSAGQFIQFVRLTHTQTDFYTSRYLIQTLRQNFWSVYLNSSRVFCSGCLNSSVSFKTQTNKNLVPPPVSAERVVSGGGEYPGCSDFTKPQRLLPSHDARRLRAAGGQRVVRSETCVRVKLSLYVSVSVCKNYRSLIWRCSHCFLSCPAATSQARSAWRLSAEWTAWQAAFPACSALWRSMTSCSSCT